MSILCSERQHSIQCYLRHCLTGELVGAFAPSERCSGEDGRDADSKKVPTLCEEVLSLLEGDNGHHPANSCEIKGVEEVEGAVGPLAQPSTKKKNDKSPPFHWEGRVLNWKKVDFADQKIAAKQTTVKKAATRPSEAAVRPEPSAGRSAKASSSLSAEFGGSRSEPTFGLTNQKSSEASVGARSEVVPPSDQYTVFDPGRPSDTRDGYFEDANQEWLSRKAMRKRTGATKKAVPGVCYVVNFYSELDHDFVGSVLDDEHEEKPVHEVSVDKHHKEEEKQDIVRWRNMRLSEFDKYLQDVMQGMQDVELDLPPAKPPEESTRAEPTIGKQPHTVGHSKTAASGRKTTAEILACSAKDSNRGIGRSVRTSIRREANEAEEMATSSSSDRRGDKLEGAHPTLIEAERECRAYQSMIAREVYRLEMTEKPLVSQFGNLRYQCVPFQQMHDSSSFSIEVDTRRRSAIRKEKQLRNRAFGINHAYVAVNLVDGQVKQVTKVLSRDEYIEYKDTYSIIDSGAGAHCVTENTHLEEEQLSPPERFKAFNQTESKALSKGTAIGRAATIDGKFTPLRLPEAFKMKEVVKDLIAVDGLDQMGFKFVLQGAANSYVECPNGAIIPLIKSGRLYWLRWEKAVEKRRENPTKTRKKSKLVHHADLQPQDAECMEEQKDDMAEDIDVENQSEKEINKNSECLPVIGRSPAENTDGQSDNQHNAAGHFVR